MLRTLRLLPLVALLALACAPAARADVPPGASWSEVFATDGKIVSADGTKLHADILRPADKPLTPVPGSPGDFTGESLPVILSIGPYFAHCGQTPVPSTDPLFPPQTDGCQPLQSPPSDRWDDLISQGKIFEKGYTLVLVDLRGFGASQGCNDFGGNGEQADAKAAIEWAAAQPWSTGKVGMWGKSYDAWTEVMALDQKPAGLAGAVIQSPIVDGYRTLYQNGVHYDTGWYYTPGLYQGIDAQPPTLFDQPQYYGDYARGTDPACYGQNIAFQDSTREHDTTFWNERDLPDARGSSVPVLWSHGFRDANTKPDNFMPVWSSLTGPHRAWFGQYNHVRGNDRSTDPSHHPVVGRDGFMDEAMRWMDRYVKGASATDAPVENDPPVEVQDSDGMWRAELQWPPADATRYDIPLRAGTYDDSANNFGEGVQTAGAPGTPTGVGIWSITQPLPYRAHIAGEPEATVNVEVGSGVSATTPATLVAILYDVGNPQEGKGNLISRAAYAVKSSGTVTFKLYPQDWVLEAGHRLGVLIAGADEDWWTPPHTDTTVTVGGGGVSLPYLRYIRNTFLEGGPSDDMANRLPIDISQSTIDSSGVTASFPPELVPAPGLAGAALASAPPAKKAAAKRKKRLTAKIRLLGKKSSRGGKRALRISGRAPSKTKVRVTLRRKGHKLKSKRVKARKGHYRATFYVGRAGVYSGRAQARIGGVLERARSRRLTLRSRR